MILRLGIIIISMDPHVFSLILYINLYDFFKLCYETLKATFDELTNIYILSYFLYSKISSNGHLQNLLLGLFILNINAKPKNYLLKALKAFSVTNK